MKLERLGPWPARLAWLVAPLTAGPALSAALQAQASTPGLIVEIALWLGWFIVLVSLLTPSPRSLTISRIAGPAALGAAVLAAVAEGWDGAALVAIGFAAVFVATTALPTFGDHMINGSAYGSERRMALRAPAFALVGPLQLAWLLVFTGVAAPLLLILAERWLLAGLAAAAGAAAVWAGGRVLHQLARRWIVFVPAGFVIHDPMTMVDSVLLRRSEVAAVGPAIGPAPPSTRGEAPEGRIDLSGGALGLALEVALRSPTPITARGGGNLLNLEVTNLVFTPTLPGAVLSEARIRGLRIGEASPQGQGPGSPP